jgi:uncharacterized protein (DUF1810 family)
LTKKAYNLQRFIAAQNPIFEQVLLELEMGKKQTHWMWFVFPQIKGLGQSEIAKRYAISCKDEAVVFLAHPILGPRLERCTRMVNELHNHTAEQIFGHIDAMKFWSSMTLFTQAPPGATIFQHALDKFYGGNPDLKTLELLE